MGNVRVPLPFIVYNLLVFTYCSGLFLLGSTANIRYGTTFAFFELVFLSVVQFLLYVAQWAAPNYHVESLGFDHAGGGMSILLLTTFVSIVNSNSVFTKLSIR